MIGLQGMREPCSSFLVNHLDPEFVRAILKEEGTPGHEWSLTDKEGTPTRMAQLGNANQ